MAGVKNDPVDPRVRLAIARWPEKAPRGAVSSFCVEHGISRQSFYEIRRRAVVEGPAAALEPRSRRPRTSPTRISEQAKQDAVDVRSALERSGLDHGPISVFDKMTTLGLQPPSIAALSRIFREKGVARLEPKKKPRAAYRRFVYPAPNACWQLDATQYVLAQGRSCVIFQLQDDHSRLAVASLVATGETSEAALTVVKNGIAARGVPQRLLTDNGMALNPSRRGWHGQLVTYVTGLGVQPITGRPGRPTTQGKNERFHQTLFRWLDKQPIAATIAELQHQVDQFDHIYNTQRPHQGLPGRLTPQQAWDATPVTDPPRPHPTPTEITIPEPATATPRPATTAAAATAPTAGHILKVRGGGSVKVKKTAYQIGSNHAGTLVRTAINGNRIDFIDTLTGEVLAEHLLAPPGTRYVSNGHPRGPRRPQTSPMS